MEYARVGFINEDKKFQIIGIFDAEGNAKD